jgi:chromosome segregation protein
MEIVGFKSFADKTVLDFLPPAKTSRGITGVVGPNGSGKSNIADAIRWVLGEQSLKLLRGKKAEDVIFSGSEKRARCGFAEVSLLFNNERDELGLGYSEVLISRRLYRSGESEYLINKNRVRLSDIQMLLAQASFGTRSYSVIGQGMADWILVATPQERKEFFDEAAGVKQYQLKRHQSLLKLDASRENLRQAEMLISEIEPRLRSLQRQVKRLEERGDLEQELHGLTHQYYGSLWLDLTTRLKDRTGVHDRLQAQWQEKDHVRQAAISELAKLEKEETGSDGFSELQRGYERLMNERNALRNREFQLRSKLEIVREVRKQTHPVMPLSKIIEEIKRIGALHEKLLKDFQAADTMKAMEALSPQIEAAHEAVISLRDALERPAPEAAPKREDDPSVVKELSEISGEMKALDAQVAKAQTELTNYRKSEQEKKSRFFSLQRSLQEKIDAAHTLERRLSEEKVEIARLEARCDALEQEMSQELGERIERVKQGFDQNDRVQAQDLFPRIQKVKYQLQLIGGIDEDVVKEFNDTKGRYDYLLGQTTDLSKAIKDLDQVIDELDATIKNKSEAAFKELNGHFGRYFQQLFDGGRAELIPIRASDKAEPDDAVEAGPPEQSSDEKKRADRVVGIDIMANPPGKKIKNINMLSGGERAMASIALICAIMTSNPSPFVVLDEVDAALDESNADRYAAIIEELAHRTQFIVITHNRYTMKRANVLYGVSMRQDGTSAMLSVNLDAIGELKNDKTPEKITV